MNEYKELMENMLTEDRISFIKEKNPGLSAEHEVSPEDREKSSEEIIDHIANHFDPSPQKKNTQWLVNQYKNKAFRLEDAPRYHEALSNFEKYKSKLQNKDLNQYKHISDVEDAVEPHLGTASSKGEELRQIKDEGADKIYDKDGLTVHKLKTQEAACQYGAGTKWCTAAKEGNRFKQYNNSGPLYVVNTPDKKKFQFHFETHQFANEKDEMQDPSKLVDAYPDLKNVPEFKEKGNPAFMEQHEISKRLLHISHDDADVEKAPNISGLIGASTDQNALTHVHNFVESLGHESNSQKYSKAIKSWKSSLGGNLHTKPEILSKYATEDDLNYAQTNPNLPGETAAHILLGAKRLGYVPGEVYKNKNLTAEHISRVFNDTKQGHSAKEKMLMHPNAGPEIFEKASKDPNLYSTLSVAPNTPSHILDDLGGYNIKHLRVNVAKHPNTSTETLKRLSNDSVEDVSTAATKQLKKRKAL